MIQVSVFRELRNGDKKLLSKNSLTLDQAIAELVKLLDDESFEFVDIHEISYDKLVVRNSYRRSNVARYSIVKQVEFEPKDLSRELRALRKIATWYFKVTGNGSRQAKNYFENEELRELAFKLSMRLPFRC